jgi:hypothetical protein
MKKSNNKKAPSYLAPAKDNFNRRAPCMSEPNYWWAVIGPVDRDELGRKYPMGEGALRWTLQQQFSEMFPDIHYSCSSGWGMTEAQKEAARYGNEDDETRKALIRSYYYEGKKMPRALRAWELLYKEEAKNFIKTMDKTIGNVVDKKRKR